jgi:hypothetical protein
MTDVGSSLVETMAALLLTMAVTTAALSMAARTQAFIQAGPEAVDAHQRLRAAADALTKDLSMAGAGPYATSRAGSLVSSFAPVIPRRLGLSGADAPGVARDDTITMAYVPTTSAQTTTSAAVPQAAGLKVTAGPNCPAGQALCGFQAGMPIVVFDSTANFDLYTVTSVTSAAAQVQSHNPSASYTYPAGAQVAQVESRTYYLDATSNQLRVYDGYQTDTPVVDNVVALSFEYFGDPNPPTRPQPPAGVSNCLYDAAGAWLPLPTLAGPADGLVPLPLAMFRDGPWCGNGANRYDADLLRVRKVRVTLRLQSAVAAFRASGVAFVKPGTSRASERFLPDVSTTIDVVPRNLNTGR